MRVSQSCPWVALAACVSIASSAGAQTTGAPDQPMRTATAEQAKSAAGGKAVHDAMMKGMQPLHSMKPSGNADRDFAAMMIHHHEQAILMAEAQLKHGTDEAVRKKAQEIIAASRKDIADLRRWQQNSDATSTQASDP